MVGFGWGHGERASRVAPGKPVARKSWARGDGRRGPHAHPAGPRGHAVRLGALHLRTAVHAARRRAAFARPRPARGVHQALRDHPRARRGRHGESCSSRGTRSSGASSPSSSSTSAGRPRPRLLAEAQATARARHENIVVIYEVGELDGRPYMVLEYLEGRTLRQVISTGATGRRARAAAGLCARHHDLRRPRARRGPRGAASYIATSSRRTSCCSTPGR